jgi:hypothetical protein
VRLAGLLFPLLGLSIGCGDDPDHWKAGRPRIDDLRFVQQSPQDPYALEFLVAFADSDGDTGAGALRMFVGGVESAKLELPMVFENQTPPLDLAATAGEIEVVVRVGSEIGLGQQLVIGFVIEDAAGRRSNDPWIELEAF